MMNSTRCFGRARFLVALGFLSLIIPWPRGSAALAAWSEGRHQILALSELLPQLTADLNGPVRNEMGTDAAVLLVEGADPDVPQTLRAALLLSGMRLREDRGAWTVVPAQPKPERERALDRAIPVSPVAPAPGTGAAISTGGVAFFGHLMPPPFSVTRSGDVIEINGVPVFPSPGVLTPPPAPSVRVVEIFDRMESARESYLRNRDLLGVERASTELTSELRAIPGFTEVEWIADDEVRILREDGIEERMSFAEFRPPDPDNSLAQERYLDEQVLLFREILEEEGTLLCGATYLIPVQEIGAGDFRRRVEEVAGSPEEDALKLARIQAYTGNRDAAADLLYAR